MPLHSFGDYSFLSGLLIRMLTLACTTAKHDGNLTLDDVIEVAKAMRPRSMARTFAGTVKEILGTAVSLGCTIDGRTPRDMQKAIDDGEFDERLAQFD